MPDDSTGEIQRLAGSRGNLGSVSDPLRLEALQRSGLLDASPTGDIRRVLDLAVRCLDASCAAFLAVSGDGFHCRGSAGLPESWAGGDPWPLDWPFLLEGVFEGPVVVGSADAVAARLAALPEAPFRAFAGAPLRDPEGNRLGLLALWCERDRAWRPEDVERIRGFAATLEDLVAHRLEARRREEEIKAAADRLRQAAESGCDLLYELDLRSGALRLVGSMERLLGYAPGELPLHTDSWRRVLHPEDRERILARVQAHLEAGRPYFEEYRVLCKDGSVRHWSDRGRALRTAGGRPTRWVGMINDITGRKRGEEALRRVQADRDAILEALRVPVFARDLSGRIVFANRAAARFFGYPSPEALMAAERALPTDRYAVADEDGRPVDVEDLPGLAALRGEARQGTVLRLVDRADGTALWTVADSAPLADGRGRVRLSVTAFHDVTGLKRAQLDLARGRDEIDFILRAMDCGIVALDGAGRSLYANPAAARQLGCASVEELAALGAEAILARFEILDRAGASIPPERLPAARALRGERVEDDLACYRNPATGEVRWARISAIPVIAPGGGVRMAILMLQDVTALRRAEEANARHLRFLERTDAVARAGESALDAEKALPAVLGKVLEVMDCRAVLLVHPADPDALEFRIPFWASREGGLRLERHLPSSAAIRELARRVLAKDGPLALRAGEGLPEEGYWRAAFGAASLLSLAIRPRAGKPWLFCLLRPSGARPWTAEDEAVFRDLGTRITAALGNMLLYRDLRRSEEKYRTLFERSLDGVFRCAPDGTVLDANPALVDMLGYAGRADLVGTAQRQLLPAMGLENLPGRREPFIVELARADGGRVWAEVIAQAVRRSDGEVVCFEGVVRNVDDRKRTEAALKENEEVLRQAQKMEAVGRLAGGVAHDFNNLLTAINGFGDLLLLEVGKDDPRRLHVEEIRRAGERAAGLTSQLLAFSRKQVLAPRLMDMGAVVAGMEPMLRRLIGENIDFTVAAAPDLPPTLIDPSQAEQIVLNLALNARDAMPTGGRLHIRTTRRRLGGEPGGLQLEAREGDYASLEVIDTGVGMDDETKARLFEPFFTTKEKDKGTGLGLSMVYGAVKQGNGTIEVETRKGCGTTFRVLLPAASREAEPAAARRLAERPASAAGGTETILLVEDEDAVRRLVRDVLRFNGYRVLEAPGGEKALEAAARHDGAIHLLLTDVVMGGMSGRELAGRLRAARPDTRVLYMSGYTEDAIIRHGVLSSHTAFLGKPFSPAALAAKVREVLTAAAVPEG